MKPEEDYPRFTMVERKPIRLMNDEEIRADLERRAEDCKRLHRLEDRSEIERRLWLSFALFWTAVAVIWGCWIMWGPR